MNRILRSGLCLLLATAGVSRLAAVSVSSFSPVYGSPGSPNYITITGTGFYPGTVEVRFNGALSPDAAAITTTTILAAVPVGATTGPIQVSVYNVATGWLSAQSANNFIIGPYVASFSPTVGGGAVQVTLTGGNFSTVTNVTFNGVKGTGLSIPMDTTLTVFTPVTVTSGPIALSSPQGTFVTSSNFWVPPTLTNMAPASGRAGTNVVLRGNNLAGTTSVLFAGTNGPFMLPGAFQVWSNTALSATVPATAVTGKLRVITAAGSKDTTNNFTMLPVIYSQSTNVGVAGTKVTLNGANFNVPTTTVKFNGLNASALSGLTFDTVVATAPAGVTTGPISITTGDGGYTNLDYFYVPASITAIRANNGPPGTRITITGQNLLGATSVTFNGMPANGFTVTNNTSIGATVPLGVPTGPIIVTTPAGSVSSALFYGTPVITGFSPTNGLPGTNVIIYGTNLLNATSVAFNGVPASFTATNSGFISATVPLATQSGPIRVVTPGGTNTSADSFLISQTDLAVTVIPSVSTVFVGSNYTYTIHIVNNGPADAFSVVLTNRLPAGVSLLLSHASQGTLNTSGAPITGDLGQINAGTECLVTLTVRANATGSMSNLAWVACALPDLAPANNTNVTGVSVLPLPLLSVQALASQLRISWPLALSNYTLQYIERLDTNRVWTNISRAPIQSGGLNQITETNDRPARFYRLISP